MDGVKLLKVETVQVSKEREHKAVNDTIGGFGLGLWLLCGSHCFQLFMTFLFS